MSQYRQPLLTIFIIFATAYVLTLIGCAKSPDAKPLGTPPPARPHAEALSADEEIEIPEKIDSKDMRECTREEFSKLQVWGRELTAADKAILAMGKSPTDWKKDAKVINIAISAINKCDEAQYYHTLKPCKNVTPATILTAEIIKAYDGYRINERCLAPHRYLTQFGIRPDPKESRPTEPVRPPVVQPPVTRPPVVQPPVDVEPMDPVRPPVVPNPNVGNIRSCNETEFTKLKSLRTALDVAGRQVNKLGLQANWKYDQSAIESSQAATGSCESLMAYHQTQPCQRVIKNDQTRTSETKMYSADSIRQQCHTPRTYYYEFAQRAESLIVANANLYLSTKIFNNQPIVPGYNRDTIGVCVVTNESSDDVIYRGEKALVVEARVYPDREKMAVFKTAEGVKLECYGMEFTSIKTSKSEVVRLLRKKETPISLIYELK